MFQTHFHHPSSELFGCLLAEVVEHPTHRANIKKLEDYFVNIEGEVDKPARWRLRSGVLHRWLGHESVKEWTKDYER